MCLPAAIRVHGFDQEQSGLLFNIVQGGNNYTAYRPHMTVLVDWA